jgi:hypothetical protein
MSVRDKTFPDYSSKTTGAILSKLFEISYIDMPQDE